MIDVIFFMLILFLLVAPIVEYGINVNLPAASAKKMEEPQTLTVNVTNTDTGPRIYLDRDRLTLEELTSRLKSIAARQPDIALILRADKELNYESVIQVIDCITEAGITKLGMATVAKAETPKKQRKK